MIATHIPSFVLMRIQDLTLGGTTVQDPGSAADAMRLAGEVVTRDVSIMELLISGGWYIMLPLAVMSFIALFIFFERSMAIRKAAKEDKDFMAKLKDYLSAGNLDSARNLCEQSGTPIARMLHKGIARIGKPLKDISTSIENVGKLEIYSMERNLSTLATIAGAAPMIGFLGTVIGMVNVFLDMESAGMVRVRRHLLGHQAGHDHHHRRPHRWHHCLHGVQPLGEPREQGHPHDGGQLAGVH